MRGAVIRCLALDPGLDAFGWALVELRGATLLVVGAGALRTSRHAELEDAADLARRGDELAAALDGLWERLDVQGMLDVVAVKEFRWYSRDGAFPTEGNRSLRATVTLAYVAGIASEKLRRWGCPDPAQLDVADLRRAVCGAGTAKRPAVARALSERLGVASFPIESVDAVAAGIVAVEAAALEGGPQGAPL